MTPRVPWKPLDVLQILLAWILAMFISQVAYGLLFPPRLEGTFPAAKTVSLPNPKTDTTFQTNVVQHIMFHLDKTYSLTNTLGESSSGTFEFLGDPPFQNRFAITLAPTAGSPEIINFNGTVRDRVGMVLVNIAFVQGGALALVLLLAYKYRRPWREVFGGLGDPSTSIALPILWGCIFMIPAFALNYLSQLIMINLGGEPTVQDSVLMVAQAEDTTEIALYMISVVVMAPIAEELLFRGVIYTSIKEAGHPRAAVFVSAVLFGAVHNSLALFLPLTMLAVVLVWIYEKTGRILAPIIMHATFNAINFGLIKFAPDLF